jgi:hypothetical protein
VDNDDINHPAIADDPHLEVEKSSPNLDNLWLKRSKDDVAYQRQAQVTWWTLMGGIALGALLTQLDPLQNEARAGNWYYLLYFFATCFIIVNSWVQTAWGALILRWPLSIGSSLILFFSNLSLSIAALSITHPTRWYGSIASMLVFTVLMQDHFKKQQSWVTLTATAIQRVRTGVFIYLGLLCVVLTMTIILMIFPIRLLEILSGIFAVALSVLALYWQHIGMQVEKREVHIA